jgi:uncharacterized protein
MIHVVFDTNVVISGSLWSGAPKRALMAAQAGQAKAFVSEAMLDELNAVIVRPKFASRLNLLQKDHNQIVAEYLQYAEVIDVAAAPPLVSIDRDDDLVLACAFSAAAHYIVSGDPHLLTLGTVQGVHIITVATFLQEIDAGTS